MRSSTGWCATKRKRDSYAKQAEAHKTVAIGIAKLIDLEGKTSREAWCSACLTRTDHRKLMQAPSSLPAYLCTACGSPTLGCAAPGCPHMRDPGLRIRCAFRGTVPNTDTTSPALRSLRRCPSGQAAPPKLVPAARRHTRLRTMPARRTGAGRGVTLPASTGWHSHGTRTVRVMRCPVRRS